MVESVIAYLKYKNKNDWTKQVQALTIYFIFEELQLYMILGALLGLCLVQVKIFDNLTSGFLLITGFVDGLG